MGNIEQYVRSIMNRYDVLVAIITETAQLFDTAQAEKAFRECQLEIMNCKHPTLYRETSGRYARVFIYGVTAYMKEEDGQYLEKFLNACKGDNVTEIIGIKNGNLH